MPLLFLCFLLALDGDVDNTLESGERLREAHVRIVDSGDAFGWHEKLRYFGISMVPGRNVVGPGAQVLGLFFAPFLPHFLARRQ